jgi:hypothetical protein
MPTDPKITHEDMPASPGEPMSKPVMVDPETLKQAIGLLPAKPTLPALNYVGVMEVEGKPVLTAGLPVVTVPVPEVDGQYPDWRKVVPEYGEEQQPLRFGINGKLLKQVCDMAMRDGDANNMIVFEVPTVKGEVVMQDNGTDPVTDANGDLVFENRPLCTLKQGVKFTISKYDGDTVYSGAIMPLRIK